MGFASKSYYDILDIDPAATSDEVRKSYSTVRATWDPGALATYSLYSPAESELISSKVEEAYQILTDAERRRRYDRYRRYMEGACEVVSTPDAFWEAVEGAGPAEATVMEVTELLTSGEIVEDPAVSTQPSEIARRVGARPEVEREWRDLVAERGTSESEVAVEDEPEAAPAAEGRSEAALGVTFRPPPVRRTWVSPTVAGSSPEMGAAWRRPDRGRPVVPRALQQSPVAEEVIARLQEELGHCGALLKQVRELKGITLETIAEHTKIGTTYLRDIELEDFGSLPPAVYLRGFLAQYVKLLRLDPEIVRGYMARFEAVRGES